jgi:hypothetical protein
MDEVKVFLALAGMTVGLIFLRSYILIWATEREYASNFVFVPVVGAVLIAGSATYFWINGRSYNR